MLSALPIAARTSRSIVRLVPDTSTRDRVSTGLPRMLAGKSHSCEMPTRSSAAPRAHTISLADGSNETIRTRRRPSHTRVPPSRHSLRVDLPVDQLLLLRLRAHRSDVRGPECAGDIEPTDRGTIADTGLI